MDRPSDAFFIEKWADFHALLMTIGTIITVVSHNSQVLAVCALLSFTGLFFADHNRVDGKNVKWSAANLVTALRLCLVLLVLSLFNMLSVLTITTILTLSVCLDVLDGFIARRTRRNTQFGQYFDMESDAFFVLAMGVYFWMVTPYGLWLLLPGLLRYAYRMMIRLKPKSQFTEKKRTYAAFLAGTNFILLLLAIPLSGWPQLLILILSTTIVCCSFGLSFVEYALFKGPRNQRSYT